jgi:hypothetical protein
MYLCFRLAQNTKQKKESFHTIDEAYIILASYLNNCFDSLAIYYRNDITFKLNKKE